MKILAINGSHRGGKGHTQFLIDRLFQGAGAAGAACECVCLAGMRIKRCLACGRCHDDDHYLRCVYDEKDEVRSIFRKMAEANLIVYATPVYVFGMSGLLKTFLDRLYGTGNTFDLQMSESGLMFHHIDRAVCSKPFVTLVCCDNLEGLTPHNVLDYFKVFSKFMDAPQVGVLVRNGGRLAGHGKDPARLAAFPRLKASYEAYEEAGRELATRGRIRWLTQRRANREIIPVPLFGLLKRLPFRKLKRKFVENARAMQERLNENASELEPR